MFLCIACQELAAQCKLSIVAPDSLAFAVAIDGEQVNTRPINQISIFEVATGKHEIQVKVAKLNAAFSVTMKKYIHYQYQLTLSDNVLELLPLGESKLQMNQFKIVSTEPSAEKVYAGLRGCDQPISKNEFDSEFERLKAMPFDSQRKIGIKELCGKKCLNTNQLIACLTLLELEENRIDAMADVVSRVFDLENVRHLLDLLYLDGNKSLLENRILEITQKQDKQP